MTKAEYFIETERLRFRPWCKEDLNLALGLWGDHDVTKLFDGRGPLNERQVEDRLLLEIETQEKYGVQYWPIFSKHDDKHVGAAGLRPKNIPKKQYEIGIHICSKFWHRGFGNEAALAVMQYAFDILNVSSLFAGHNPRNIASEKLLKKLGFQYIHDEYYEPTGLMHPSYTFAPGK